MRIVYILFLVIITNDLFAQEPCSNEIIMAVKGKWIKRPDANMASGNQSQLISRLDKMQQLVQAAYPIPMGMEVKWYRSMGGYYPAIDKNTVAYDLSVMLYTWYCNKPLKKLLLGTEYSSNFNIWANKFKWFAEEDKTFLIDNKPVYILTKKVGELGGFPLYAGNDNGTWNTGTRFSKTMLISRHGQLPYTPISRKQYLLVFLKNKEVWHKKNMESLLKIPVRSDSEEEEYKNKQMEKVVNASGENDQTREKARSNFLRGYTTEKQRRQADILRSEKTYEEDIKIAKYYLTNTPDEELAKPAYMKNNSYASSFREFASENEGIQMVQLNSNYFNNKLPAHSPQFLVVYWYWNTEKPSVDFADQIQKNFDFKALQTMLDK